MGYRKEGKDSDKERRKMIMRVVGLVGKIVGEMGREMGVDGDEEVLN